jgi:hypothetical protein
MLLLLLRPQVVQALTADSTADLLAVALNLATAAHADTASCFKIAQHIMSLLVVIKNQVPEAQPQEAAAAEALLRLFIQLCRRPHVAGAAAAALRMCLTLDLAVLCSMPGAEQLPAETVVELVELLLQIPMFGAAPALDSVAACQLLQLLSPRIPGHRLAPAHVKRLLALLGGPTAAAATAAYQHPMRYCGDSPIMVWLARQPQAVAAAAELGLTAADVPDPAAAALLFGGQRYAGGV